MDLPVVKLKNIKQEILLAYPEKIFKENEIHPATTFKGRRATFQAAMKITIIIGQYFALNPVLGISEIDTCKVSFRGFYTSSCITTILFMRVATKWPKLCKLIARTEAADPNTDVGLVRRCNMACLVILSLALLEHVLSDVSGIAGAIDCDPDVNLYESFVVRSFPWIYEFVPYNHFIGVISQIINIQCTFNWNFANLFVICVSLYLTSRLEQVNKRIMAVKGKDIRCRVVMAEYNTILSKGVVRGDKGKLNKERPADYVSCKQKAIDNNCAISAVKSHFSKFRMNSHYCPSSFWRSMREDYSRVTNLVRLVDDVIGSVIFISFANNLFFICVQLLHTLADGIKRSPPCHPDTENKRPFQGYEPPVYFAFSFSFLVIRSLAVSLIASQVHTASREPAHALYVVPSATYCIEVQRFLNQIHGETVALSGLQFFHVKRGIVLAIAGTIVTYELVLLQFTGVTPTSASPTIEWSH